MRELTLRRVLWLAAFVLCLVGSSSTARAEQQFGVVALDLRPEGGDVPTHLCVVSPRKSDRARDKIGEVLAGSPDRVRGAAGGEAQSWQVKPSVWGGGADSAERQKCVTDPLSDCRPRVELPNQLAQQGDLYVACTADNLTEGGEASEARTLFIQLDYLEGSPPQIESVHLAGGVATIGVFGVSFERVTVTARSLGGHYLAHQRSERARGDGSGREQTAMSRQTIQLGLTPRCQDIEVRLPRTRVKPGDRDRLDVRVNGRTIDVDSCVGNLVGAEVIQIRMPPAPLAVGSIDVTLKPSTSGSTSARFGGSFEGRWPKTPFALEFNQVSFTWRRPDCIYPRDTCPAAVLETGTRCTGSVTADGCSYMCPGEYSEEGAIDLELPLGVTFEKDDPKQSWTDRLAQNGQELSSYVAADDIYLSANINDWETEKPDNRINGIEIYGEDGEARRYGVTHVDRLMLRVPGAGLRGRGGTCESIRFKPVGDRGYDEIVATVSDGELDLGRPERAAKLVRFNLTLLAGGGPAWSTDPPPPPVYFTGLGMLAVQIQPRRKPWNRFALEMRAGGTLGTWAVPVGADEETGAMRDPEEEDVAGEEARQQRVGWARVLFEPGMVVSLHERIAMGAGFGMGFSLPFRDVDITGKELKFVWSPSLDARFRLRGWLRLVIQFRGVFGEEAFSRQGTMPVEGDTARSLLILAGLQASF